MFGLLASILPSFLGPALEVINKLIPDKDLAAKFEQELRLRLIDNQADIEKAICDAAKAQIEVNVEEAKNPSLFVAGWRPAAGWISVFGLGYQFALQPFITWVSVNAGWSAPPTLDVSTLTTLLFGMLGLGAYRTYEKYQEVDTKKVGFKK